MNSPEAPGFVVLRTQPHWIPFFLRLGGGGALLVVGLRRFLDPNRFGVGALEALGLPFPAFLAPLAGGFEVVCGALLLVGLGVRIMAFPPLTLLLGGALVGGLPRAHPGLALLLAGALLLLLRTGGGARSMDLWILKKGAPPGPEEIDSDQGQGSGITG